MGVFLFVFHGTKQWLLGGACLCWLMVVGVHGAFFDMPTPAFEVRGEVVLSGMVYEVLGRDGSSQRIRVVEAQACHGRCELGVILPGRIELVTNAFPRLTVGDRVRASCTLISVDEVNVETFRYDRYLAKEGVTGVCRGYAWPRIIGYENSVRSRLLAWRESYAHVLQRHLSEPHVSLLEGLLYGAQSSLPDEIQEQFRRTGTSHIVAVSGYNVMLVAVIVQMLLTATVLRRQHAFLFVLVGIVLFVVLTGADASVVRAGIMGSLVLVARHIGRPRSALILFLLTASAMTIANPRVLLDDVGFQLSFAAAAGLVWLGPHIDKRLAFLPKVVSLRSTLSETLAAILATLPIMLLRFRQVSIVAPIANMFVVPLIPVTMLLGVLGSMIAMLGDWVGLPWVGDIAMLPSFATLDLMLSVIASLSNMPFLVW